MGDKVTLSLSERELHGKKVAKLRKEGQVPAVVYGPGIEPVSVRVEERVLVKAYKKAGTHAPVHLTIGTKKKIAMIKDIDRDPVKGNIRHVSFHAVKATDPVVAEVPVRLVGEGESEAEKSGLIVLQNIEKVEVKALPMDLPEAVEVSILGLKEAGDRVTLADAKLPDGVDFVEHDSHHGDDDEEERSSVTDQMVASVWEPAALAAANDAAAGDATDESEVESENGEAEAPVEGEAAKGEGDEDKAE